MTTYTIHYRVTEYRVAEVEADSLDQAREKFEVYEWRDDDHEDMGGDETIVYVQAGGEAVWNIEDDLS